MKWLARQEQISPVLRNGDRIGRSDEEFEESEKGKCALSQSTIRAQRPQGLKSVGGSQSGGRDDRAAFGRPSLTRLNAITASGQLAPSFSIGLKIGRSGAGGFRWAGGGGGPSARERKRAP